MSSAENVSAQQTKTVANRGFSNCYTVNLVACFFSRGCAPEKRVKKSSFYLTIQTPRAYPSEQNLFCSRTFRPPILQFFFPLTLGFGPSVRKGSKLTRRTGAGTE